MFHTIVLTAGIVANTALVVFGVKTYQERQHDLIENKLKTTFEQIEDIKAIHKVLDDNLLVMNVTLNEQEFELNKLRNNNEPKLLKQASLKQVSLGQASLKALM